jgi:16S rRNA (guanine527-N7)-methyltransferase
MVPPPVPEGSPETVEEFRDLLIGAAREAGRPLSATEIAGMITHYRILLKWGRRMNLTGLRDVQSIARRHFLEPVETADLIGEDGTLLDLGSGNGFPAIPLAIMHPGLRLVLVESSQKKSEFLWAVIRELGLRRAKVETRRVERRSDLDDHLPTDYITFRAIRGAELLAGEGEAVLRPGGRLLAYVSLRDSARLRRNPISGLQWLGAWPLSSGKNSVVAILEPDA